MTGAFISRREKSSWGIPCFVLLLSTVSQRSNQVRHEFELARNASKKILPILVNIGVGDLAEYWAPLCHIQFDRYENCLANRDKFAKTVQHQLEQAAEVALMFNMKGARRLDGGKSRLRYLRLRQRRPEGGRQAAGGRREPCEAPGRCTAGAETMSGRRDIRLLLADVDGTLVTNDKVLTGAAKAAVQDLRHAGIAFTITSSRPPRGLRMLIEPLALRGAIAGLNGGIYVNPDLSVIECHRLDPATAKEAVNSILDQGLDVWVYTEEDWLVLKVDAPHVAREAWILKFDPTAVASFTDAHLAGAVKIAGVSDDLELVAACEKAAQKAFGEKASIVRSQPYFLDVTGGQANKGAVVDTLSKRLNIPSGQIATIGDMPNDVLMFRKSGFSIAMGNSSDEVKAQASAVTESNENEGFAKAVRKFLLPS